MESRDIDKMKHLANTEVIRRLLIKYFMDKGFVESFDRQLYPSLLQDLPMAIPVLGTKVEIIPYAEDVDNMLGRARLGWNMFVLGNHRMYLGETFHNDLRDLARHIHTGMIPPSHYGSARKQTTPKRVIAFITRVLGNSEMGYVDLSPPSSAGKFPHQALAAKQAMTGMSQQFYNRPA